MSLTQRQRIEPNDVTCFAEKMPNQTETSQHGRVREQFEAREGLRV